MLRSFASSRPSFYALDFDEKKAFVGVVHAYYYDGTGSLDVVRLIDSRTGKTIGSFSDLGLDLK